MKNYIQFAKKSDKIFTKIEFVNALTPKEISFLNDRYLHLGLNIKQIVVDNFGIEIYDEKSSFNELIGRKRNRKDFNSLQDFLSKYYAEEEINKSTKKCKNSDGDKFSKEELLELRNSLNSLKEDCQEIEYKNCKIEINEFKTKIIDYILKYKQYITKEEYSYLFNKWKNELSKIKGVNVFNFSDMNDLNNWKVPILKAFKSEIILYALCNICEKKIRGKNIINENQNENQSEKNNSNNNLIEENKNGLSEQDSESSEHFDDFNYFNNFEGQFLKEDNDEDL